MDWYDLTSKYHQMTFACDDDLESLSEAWQRELAAVWRLEADINNGGYLQFIANWGLASHRYGLAALRKMGADTMATIVADCYSVLHSAVEVERLDREQLQALIPNVLIDRDGHVIKEAGSTLPKHVLTTLDSLSRKFMNYPNDLAALGLEYYGPYAAD